MNIQERKHNIAKEYGDDPTLTLYYYCWNVVDYAGEERVRETFESIAGQGDEVIVGMYDPQDTTEELANEYGLKTSIIEKEDHDVWDFPESKVRNKIIVDSTCNFVAPLNINVTFESDFGTRIKKWIKKNDVCKKMLRIRYKFRNDDGSTKQYGKTQVMYKPFLLAARGYDERTGFCTGSQRYGGLMMRRVFKLQKINWDTDMFHKRHNHYKQPLLDDIGISPKGKSNVSRKEYDKKITKNLHELLQKDFDKYKWKVKNSYW